MAVSELVQGLSQDFQRWGLEAATRVAYGVGQWGIPEDNVWIGQTADGRIAG